MRLWTLHPKYLDPKGLVALWREALLAKAVIRGETRGYKNHPQLDRFFSHKTPLPAIDAYLAAILDESISRGYSFDRTKTGGHAIVEKMSVTSGQLEFEWSHLLAKLSGRSPLIYRKWRDTINSETHPIFYVTAGPIEPWERGQKDNS